MKTMILSAISLVALSGAAPSLTAPAAAQHRVIHTRTVVHDGPRREHVRRVCRTVYRHHHRIRTCRTVRR